MGDRESCTERNKIRSALTGRTCLHVKNFKRLKLFFRGTIKGVLLGSRTTRFMARVHEASNMIDYRVTLSIGDSTP